MSISKALLCSWPLSQSSVPAAGSTVQFSVYLNPVIATIQNMSNNKLKGVSLVMNAVVQRESTVEQCSKMMDVLTHLKAGIIPASNRHVQHRANHRSALQAQGWSRSSVATRRSCSSAAPDQALYQPSASIGTGSQLRAPLRNRGPAQQEREEDSQDFAGSLVTITWTSLITGLNSSLYTTESVR